MCTHVTSDIECLLVRRLIQRVGWQDERHPSHVLAQEVGELQGFHAAAPELQQGALHVELAHFELGWVMLGQVDPGQVWQRVQ